MYNVSNVELEGNCQVLNVELTHQFPVEPISSMNNEHDVFVTNVVD